MADSGQGSAAQDTSSAPASPDLSELELGRAVAVAVPAVAVLMAVVVGLLVGIGPAILILAGGGIVGTIALLWASVRTLSGDAPLAPGLADAGAAPGAPSRSTADRKRSALRAIKDLEFEHSVGKIDDEDYAELLTHYRGEAKAVMREMDRDIEPFRARAEEIARAHLAKVGLTADDAEDSHRGSARDDSLPEADALDERDDEALPILAPQGSRGGPSDHGVVVTPFGAPLASPSRAPVPQAAPRDERIACTSCSASNEVDAAFCKKCGKALSRECAGCHARNEPDALFCKKCGKALATGEKEHHDSA
jgi:ribosomal protein L40E